MNDKDQLLVLLAAVAAGFFLGMGYAHKHAAQAAAAPADNLGDGGSMAWLLNYGGGFR